MRTLVTMIIFFGLICRLSAQSYTADFKNKPLDKVLKEIIKEYDLKISFSPSLLKEYKISKEITADSPEQLMLQLFEGLPFEIRPQNNLFLIIPQKPTALSGQVVDKSTGTPLAFALVQSTNKSAIADQHGFFSLPYAEDTVVLQVSYLGYKKLNFPVAPDSQKLEINLEQNPMVLQEVVLDGNKENQLSIPASTFTLNPRQFNALPVLGETDVFKTLQLLPGISATNESTSGFNVRGSSASQNLVLMDGFTLYHLDHFFGIFSTLNPNFINSIDIYKGGFGAEYGGRVSSVVDVKSRPGNRNKISGGAGVNFLSTNFYFDVPIGDKLNVMAGFRNSFTGIVESNLYTEFLASSRQNFLSSFDDPDLNSLELSPSLSFYDLNTKVSFRPSDKATINANLYVNEDDYKGSFQEITTNNSSRVTDKADWSNAGLSLNWNQFIEQNQLLGLTLSASEYKNSESLNTGFNVLSDVEFNNSLIGANTTLDETSFQVQNQVNDMNLKLSHEYFFNDDNHLKTGFEFNNIATEYYSATQIEDFFSDSTVVLPSDTLEQQANISSAYGSFTNKIGRLATTIGFRANHYDVKNEWFIEPRINIAFQVSDQFQLKGAYTHHHQFINQTSLSYLNSDRFYWVLSDGETIPVAKSRHIILGGHFNWDRWRVEAEVYHRKTSGVTSNRYSYIPPDILQELNDFGSFDGQNLSKGLDIYVKYKANRYNSWISYSLASSMNEFGFLNNGNPYPTDEDQRHEINFVNMVKLGNWELASTLVYGSGRPFTPQERRVNTSSFYVLSNYEDTSSINSERFNSYKRIDVSAKYSFSMGKLDSEIGVSLFNVFDFKNIKSRRYVRQYSFTEEFDQTRLDDEVRIVPLDTYLLGFTPNFFVNIRF